MNKILDFVAKETGGRAYKSHRFCFDLELQVPILDYDNKLEFSVKRDAFAETDTSLTTSKNLTDSSEFFRKEKPLFTYFLDGSRRIYKVDDIEYGRRLLPAVSGQIGVACCRRKSPDEFEVAVFEKHLVLSLPFLAVNGQKHAVQFLNRLVQQINDAPQLERFEIRFDEILLYKSDRNEGDKIEEYLDRGTALIQDKMIDYEKKTVESLVKKDLLDLDNYLLKDGSLQYSRLGGGDYKERAKYLNNYRRVVGVSKLFNPELSKDKKGLSNAAKIAYLPTKHRTPAAKYEIQRTGNVFFAIWYVRIRQPEYTESPFAGVLKLEKVLVTEEEIENGLDSGEIDRITANIINERNPVCYGRDQRWANHLYPVYLTETYIKSQYISDLHFINLF